MVENLRISPLGTCKEATRIGNYPNFANLGSMGSHTRKESPLGRSRWMEHRIPGSVLYALCVMEANGCRIGTIIN